MSDSESTTHPDRAVRSDPSPPGDGSSDDKHESGASSPYKTRPRDVNAHVGLTTTEAPLSYDDSPPLPNEAPPGTIKVEDWTWGTCPHTNQWYYYNRVTGISQWENPFNAVDPTSYDRYSHEAGQETASNTNAPGSSSPIKPKRAAGGYNPSIHGNYDPNADYAKEARKEEEEEEAALAAATAATAAAMTASLQDTDYAATGTFNRFTGRFQNDALNPENHSNDAKSHRQMSAFFDVDKAANSHDGRSLKAERRNQQLTKAELKKYNDKRKAKKEEKRRAWLLD